jgi:hypothetical protein
MKNNFIQEMFISVAIIVLLVLFINPFHFWMPNTILIMLMGGLIVAFTLFASFVWKEHVQDEREDLHKLIAGRLAFLAGTGVLVIGIIVQSFKHELDFWLALTLGTMIIAKAIGIVYGRTKY